MEKERQICGGEDGNGFVWKYIVLSSAKKNRYRGSSCLASNTQFAKVNETPMSTLMKELQKPSVSNNLEMFNVVIFKGMLFLHLLSYFT